METNEKTVIGYSQQLDAMEREREREREQWYKDYIWAQLGKITDDGTRIAAYANVLQVIESIIEDCIQVANEPD